MALTTQEMEWIMMDTLGKKPQRVKGKEADKFKKAFEKDIELAVQNGWKIDIPSEIPDLD